jgi:glyoxylase-like metal-dependent hydrolase (beta-lactamase superfamily II)
MSTASHQFKVGTFECVAVSDGTFAYPANWFFSNVPEEHLKEVLRAHNLPPDQVISPYTCLLVKTGKHKILVDTGAGKFAPTTGELMPNLEIAGVKAADIDTVILTHAHPDHISGSVDAAGKPAFPNARYVLWQHEWEFWTSETIDLGAMQVPEEIKTLVVESARRCLPPIQQQVDLLERETEVVPGIRALPAPGHTPGHMAIVISSGQDHLLYLADAVLHPIHLEQPDWQTVFDLAQDRAAKTRRELLDQAAADQMNVMAYHFPFPGFGRVVSKGPQRWHWEPLSAAVSEGTAYDATQSSRNPR